MKSPDSNNFGFKPREIRTKSEHFTSEEILIDSDTRVFVPESRYKLSEPEYLILVETETETETFINSFAKAILGGFIVSLIFIAGKYGTETKIFSWEKISALIMACILIGFGFAFLHNQKTKKRQKQKEQKRRDLQNRIEDTFRKKQEQTYTKDYRC